MIKIAERFRPFTPTPGQKMPLPFSELGVQVYPAALKLLSSGEWVRLNIQGPVKGFTAQLDLERGAIRVFGHAANGYFRYWIFCRDGTPFLKQDKGDVFGEHPFEMTASLPPPPILERLSLGVTKALDWDLVRRRRRLDEILPVWFHLGQTIPKRGDDSGPSLLSQFSAAKGMEIEPAFFALFETGFDGVLYPTAHDEHYMGYELPPASDPSLILSQGAAKIRSLFLLEENTCAILPEALRLFHSGRLSHWRASFGSIAIEWSNGRLKKMSITCQKSGKYSLQFPKGYHSLRLNSRELKLGDPLEMEENESYFFDHFQK